MIITRYGLCWLCLPAIGAAIGTSATAFAQADEFVSHATDQQRAAYSQVAVLDKVVTTGTRTAKSLQSSPVEVEYIDAATLELLSTSTLAQVMEYIPGVSVSRSAKDGFNVSMMGFGSDKVLVLLDGQRLISTTNSGVDLDQIPAQNIDRIEVIRGPASVLYGSAAMGGVINIITRPIDATTTQLSYQESSYGQNELNGREQNLSLSQSVARRNWQARSTIQYQNDPGYDYDPDTEAADGTATEKLFVDAQLSAQLAGWSLNYRPQFLQETREREDDDLVVPGFGSIEEGYKAEIDRVIHDVQLNQTDWGVHLSARDARHDETSGKLTSTPRDAVYQIQNLDAQKTFTFSGHEIVTGVVWDKESLDSPEDEIHNRSAYSREGFLQWDIMPSDHVEFLLGVRAQETSRFGSHSTSRMSARYAAEFGPGRLTLRGGLAQSYKVPTLKQQYYFFDHSNVGYMVIGNPDLEPESALTKSISVSYDFNSGHQLALHAHQSQVENLIENELDAERSEAENLDVYVYQNLSKARIAGVDLSWEHIVGSAWRYGLNYTYTDKREANGQRVLYTPRHQSKAHVNWHYFPKRVQLMLYVVHESDIAVDPSEYSDVENQAWMTTNVAFKQAINNELAWRFAVENLFDVHRDTSLEDDQYDARPRDSRKLTLGLSYTF